MMRIFPLWVALAIACGNPPPDAEEPATPIEHRAEAPEPPVEARTPEELYEACRDRVELPEEDGECETDEDCTRAGCGQEVCTTVAAAEDLMSSCEMRPCFEILDTCGCNEGRCTWSIKDEVPAREGRPLLDR